MLILICGKPRAGKTTYAKLFEYKYKVLHADFWGLDGIMYLLNYIDDDVVIDGIYETKQDRKNLIQAYSGEKTKCIWLNTPKKIRQTRNGYVNIDYQFEPPTLEEGWDEIIIL